MGYSTVQYSTVQYRYSTGTGTSTVQYSTVQYSTVQYSTVQVQVQVQYSTVQYSTVQAPAYTVQLYARKIACENHTGNWFQRRPLQPMGFCHVSRIGVSTNDRRRASVCRQNRFRPAVLPEKYESCSHRPV